ncbi:MAG: UvrD-helicase domain-containing protein [Candidatus Saganbacteria bacterium]|nr:UvrD-helicase domain-containing protein [Candidatus Saganbacteria bacterium]
MNEILNSLNSEQKKAVTFATGPLLVIAGAGTGKTTVIIRRIAQLIFKKLAKPHEILALTFTDKAAFEMEARVDQLVPYGYIDVLISTFHAFGDRVLRDHAIDLGLTPDYRVLSHADQLLFLREHLFELPLNYYKSLSDPTRHLEALLKIISRLQDEDITPQQYLKKTKVALKKAKAEDREEARKQLEVAKVYQKYQELKEIKGFVDFSDQVTLTLKLFRKRPSILARFQKRYKFILVDEFQDTNSAQFELLKLLAGRKANLTVVGDDDQAIYAFRGAAIANILNFEKVYKNCKKIVLTKNYRSTQIILDTARRLIKHNDPDRLEVSAKVNKKLKALSGLKDKKVKHNLFDRVSSEADWVAQIILKKHEQGYKYSDFAILVRSNRDAQPFRQALNMLSIPHQFSGGSGLYLNYEIQLLIAFLKSIGDLADSVALYELASSQIYGLDPLDLQKMNTFAKRRNYTLYHVFFHLEDGGEFEILADVSSQSKAKVKKIRDDIKYYINYAKQTKTSEVLYHFLMRSGYLSQLMAKESEENEGRLKAIASFFEKTKEFSEVVEVDRVAYFVKYLNLMRTAGDNPESVGFDEEKDSVNVLTVHKAKGLEFRAVFLVSLLAEKFPTRERRDAFAPVKEGFHLQEERRLFYVAMTRAKEELYLTSALDYGGKRRRKVSRFVLEALDVPKADIKLLGKTPKEQIALFAPQEIGVPAPQKSVKDDLLFLSFYQIDDYLTCPLKYKYVHISHVPLLPSHQIMYGAALHKAVQQYDTAKLNRRRFSKRDLIRVLMENWSQEGFISREHEEQRLKAAKEALALFYRQQKKTKRKIKLVEEDFSVTRNNIVLRGRFDRVDSEKGSIYIVDFKSSEVAKQADADKRSKNSLQLAIYALAWKEKYEKLPFRVELYFLENGLVGSAAKDEKDILKTWQKIEGVAQGIRERNFAAQPNSRVCSYCPYSPICPRSVV